MTLIKCIGQGLDYSLISTLESVNKTNNKHGENARQGK
jgi:hypothetical protein